MSPCAYKNVNWQQKGITNNALPKQKAEGGGGGLEGEKGGKANSEPIFDRRF